jgi:hypothetical protein
LYQSTGLDSAALASGTASTRMLDAFRMQDISTWLLDTFRMQDASARMLDAFRMQDISTWLLDTFLMQDASTRLLDAFRMQNVIYSDRVTREYANVSLQISTEIRVHKHRSSKVGVTEITSGFLDFCILFIAQCTQQNTVRKIDFLCPRVKNMEAFIPFSQKDMSVTGPGLNKMVF